MREREKFQVLVEREKKSSRFWERGRRRVPGVGRERRRSRYCERERRKCCVRESGVPSVGRERRRSRCWERVEEYVFVMERDIWIRFKW